MARITEFPPEVMFVVFAHLAADRPDDAPGPRARTLSRTNFAFSHVCRHWRAAALAEPRLWTRIHALSPAPDCVPTMIARSQDLPLVVRIPVPLDIPQRPTTRGPHPGIRHRADLTPPLQLTLDALDRTAALDIAVRRWMLCRPVFYPGAAISAPRLTRLRVDGVDSAYDPPLPGTLLARDAPLLEHVELYRTSRVWPWRWVRLPCLRSLSVRATAHESASTRAVDGDTLDALLRALAHSPGLEELALIHCIPPGLANTAADLPRLRRLTLQGAADRLAALLAALAVPADAARALFPTSHTPSLARELLPLRTRFRAVTLHISDAVVHWIAHSAGPDSESVAEWKTRSTARGAVDMPAAFGGTRALDLHSGGRRAARALLARLAAALPALETLRIHGARACARCVQAFRYLPPDAFAHLREWALPDLEARPYAVAEIRKALEARHAHGHHLLVLRVPEATCGPWTASVVEEQLVGRVETTPLQSSHL